MKIGKQLLYSAQVDNPGKPREIGAEKAPTEGQHCVRLKSFQIPKCLPLLRCHTSVHHYIISDKVQVLYVCYSGSDLFL